MSCIFPYYTKVSVISEVSIKEYLKINQYCNSRNLQQCCKGSTDNISKRSLQWTVRGPPKREAEVVPSSAVHMYSFMHIAMRFSPVHIFTDLILMGKILFNNERMSHCVTKPVRMPICDNISNINPQNKNILMVCQKSSSSPSSEKNTISL